MDIPGDYFKEQANIWLVRLSCVEESYTHARGEGDLIFSGWYVLEVIDLLEEFGEIGVNHILCSNQSKLSSNQLHFGLIFSVGGPPMGLLLL